MVTQVPLDCELCLCPDNRGNKDGNSSVLSSSQEHAAPQMPGMFFMFYFILFDTMRRTSKILC